MGLLAAGQALSLLLGLLAGVWVDRVRRKRLDLSDILRPPDFRYLLPRGWGVLSMVHTW